MSRDTRLVPEVTNSVAPEIASQVASLGLDRSIAEKRGIRQVVPVSREFVTKLDPSSESKIVLQPAHKAVLKPKSDYGGGGEGPRISLSDLGPQDVDTPEKLVSSDPATQAMLDRSYQQAMNEAILSNPNPYEGYVGIAGKTGHSISKDNIRGLIERGILVLNSKGEIDTRKSDMEYLTKTLGDRDWSKMKGFDSSIPGEYNPGTHGITGGSHLISGTPVNEKNIFRSELNSYLGIYRDWKSWETNKKNLGDTGTAVRGPSSVKPPESKIDFRIAKDMLSRGSDLRQQSSSQLSNLGAVLSPTGPSFFRGLTPDQGNVLQAVLEGYSNPEQIAVVSGLTLQDTPKVLRELYSLGKIKVEGTTVSPVDSKLGGK